MEDDFVTVESKIYSLFFCFWILRVSFSCYALSIGVPLLNEAPSCGELGTWLVVYGSVGLALFVFYCILATNGAELEDRHRFRILDRLVQCERLLLAFNIGWLIYGYILYFSPKTTCQSDGFQIVALYSFITFILWLPFLIFLICQRIPNPCSPYVQGIRKCPYCLVIIERSDGCDSIRCTCGRNFDWYYAVRIPREEIPQPRCDLSCLKFRFGRRRNLSPFSSDCGAAQKTIILEPTEEVVKWLQEYKSLQEDSHANEDQNDLAHDDMHPSSVCEICYAEKKKWILKCGHEFCPSCTLRIVDEYKICPFDRIPANQEIPLEKSSNTSIETSTNNQDVESV